MEDAEELLQELVEECIDHMDIIEPILMQWDEDLSAAQGDAVNQVFRSLHTIKGGFGFFGKEHIKDLSHRMESILSRIREGEVQLTKPMLDALLAGCDLLRSLLEDVDASDKTPIDKAMVNLLPFLEEGSDVMPAHNPLEDLAPTVNQEGRAIRVGQHILRLIVHSHTDLIAQNRSPVAVIEALGEMGQVLDMQVDARANTAEQDASNTDVVYQIIYMTMAPPDIVAAHVQIPVEQIETIKQVQVSELSPAQPTVENQGPAPASEVAKPVEVAEAQAPLIESDEEVAPDTQESGPKRGAESLKVPVPIIDRLMGLASELVLHRNLMRMALSRPVGETGLGKRMRDSMAVGLQHFADELVMRGLVAPSRNEELRAVTEQLGERLLEPLELSSDQLGLLGVVVKDLDGVTSELQETVMRTRMQPVRTIFGKFPRLVRQLGKDLGKDIHLVTEGEDTEVDKTVIEAIGDPLTHLIRNSCDHGVEDPDAREAAGKPRRGTVRLTAGHENGKVVISIIDDGAGIARDRVLAKAIENGLVSSQEGAALSDQQVFQYIFHPGLSTSQQVSEVSGRGVGMDVVRTNIERLGGTVSVTSQVGQGTTFHVRLPLTLAVIPAILVATHKVTYALPQANVVELVRMDANNQQNLSSIGDRLVYRLRGELLPVVVLDQTLEDAGGSQEVSSTRSLVVCHNGAQEFGLIVDRVQDCIEIVVKPLPEALHYLDVYAGATILGDGTAALILDAAGIAAHSGIQSSQAVDEAVVLEEQAEDEGEKVELVLIGGSDGGQMAIPLSDVERLEKMSRKVIERVGQADMIQYRGEIIPLLQVDDLLEGESPSAGSGSTEADHSADTIRVVIHRQGDQRVAIAVHRIEDITRELVVARRQTPRHGVAFCAVVHARITEFLDVPTLVRIAGVDLNAGEVA